MAKDDISRHTLSVLVQDIEGIISRVTGMFTRRGYNLVSLVSAHTETDAMAEQVAKQLNKLVPVLKVVELEQEHTIARAIVLIKVTANNANRTQVVEAAKLFRAHVVDVAPESVVIEATGTPSKLRALLDILEPFGIRELVQSGHVALERGPQAFALSE